MKESQILKATIQYEHTVTNIQVGLEFRNHGYIVDKIDIQNSFAVVTVICSLGKTKTIIGSLISAEFEWVDIEPSKPKKRKRRTKKEIEEEREDNGKA